MKASSSVDPLAVLGLAITASLSAVFCLPLGAERSSVTTYAPLGGRALPVAPPPPPPPPLVAAQPSVPAPAAQTPPRKKTTHKASRRKVVAPPPVPLAPAPAAIPAQQQPFENLPDYKLQELQDRFETDPSKYPLDRTVKVAGVSLTLVALERLEKLAVLKVVITNEGAGDFFIRRFAVLSGSIELQSRSIFRILVEPHRQREGYLIFKRPEPGSAVHIVLKEDSGKDDRTINVPVPYPF